MGERETILGQGVPEAQPGRAGQQFRGVEQPQAPEEIQQIRDNILEQWRKLSPTQQVSVLADQIRESLVAGRGQLRKDVPIPDDELPDFKRQMLPLAVVAELTGYSRVRLSHLVKSRRIEGEKRRSRTRPKWFTTIEQVERYATELPDFHEFGRRGAEKRRKETP